MMIGVATAEGVPRIQTRPREAGLGPRPAAANLAFERNGDGLGPAEVEKFNMGGAFRSSARKQAQL